MAVAAKSRVTSISMKRVHNLGNYENIQYEVTVEVAEKDDPGRIFTALEGILNDVQAKTNISQGELIRVREVLAKPKSELSGYEKENLPACKEKLNRYEEIMKRRQKARAALSTLNYTVRHNDAKLNWDDGDY